jgi:UDP-N-acetylmuramoyl-L-alanyl-D-glutamate--2,6-diaminopimelate ligase
VVVDYAHTPDGLARVLGCARRAAAGGAVTVVFGCGGDRDRAKRPAMGRVAAAMADRAVLTSDNPRGEDPLAIIDEVRAGVTVPSALVVEPDRAAAIRLAVAGPRPGDVVVIAGKGHETGQEAAGVVTPFDDREVALAALKELAR